jgi:hypothetical protein
MRVFHIPMLAIVSVLLSGCSASWSKPNPPQKWSTGFWLWQGTYNPAEPPRGPIETLYVQIGEIRHAERYDQVPGTQANRKWTASAWLPKNLPDAKEYWVVFRCDRQTVPDLQSAQMASQQLLGVLGQARVWNLNVVGVQLDIDSPTDELAEYAKYLHEFRRAMPQGLALSITALLDWFRSGTAIADVIREVDEFVPQFYDVNAESFEGGGSIAGKIDAARWSPVFNRLGKRYRIGISTFGRARLIPREAGDRSKLLRISTFRDLVPLDIAANSAFRLEADRNAASEVVLNYRVTKKVRVGYTDFDPGDTVQFVLTTPDAIRTAVERAHKMGGNVAGVIFFRWPDIGESLTMRPDEVLAAAGLHTQPDHEGDRIDVANGRCAAVACVDVYLESHSPFSPKPLRYRVHSSVELDYFLPEKNVPVRMAGPSDLEVSLPPYCARGRLYLGRAITARNSEFAVEEEP